MRHIQSGIVTINAKEFLVESEVLEEAKSLLNKFFQDTKIRKLFAKKQDPEKENS